MFPQSELENYKLQVELLQEKLKNSEENRRQLEQQLEKTLLKRNEHDKQVRAKTRQKYQQFLDEQQKRNERNKMLVALLERIDQQTAAMSARSERLKMMKLQYEMYFAKLVQTQTRQCIQNTPPAPITVTNTAIPVLLPAAPSATVSGVVVDKSPTVPDVITPRGWTLAMATPTPAGMLVTSTAPQAMPLPIAPEQLAAANPYGYLQQPMAYMSRLQQQQLLQLRPADEMMPLAQLNDCSDSTTLATLSAFDKMSDVLASLTTTAASTTTTISTPISLTPATTTITLTQPQYGSNANDFSLSAPTGNNPDFMSATPTTSIYKAQQWQQQQQQKLSTLSPTYSTSAAAVAATAATAAATPTGVGALTASSPLTFDKLPKKPLTMTEENFSIADKNNTEDVATSNIEKPQIVAFDDSGKYDELKTPPTSASRNVGGNESAAAVAAAVTTSAIVAADGAYVVATPKAPTLPQFDGTPKGMKIEENNSNNSSSSINIKADTEAHHQNVSAGFAQLPLANANKPTEPTEVTAVAASGNQSLKPSSNVSIENIENAIYGELLNPADELPPERFDNYLTQTQQPVNATITNQDKIQEEPQYAAVAPPNEPTDYAAYATLGGEETTVSSLSYNQEVSDSYEPTYATIDDNAGAAEGLTTAENAYVDQADAAEYAQYTSEGQGEGANDAQQVYDGNLDYSNYDAYDPNAYPGYTYDETTGQYTPDPNQQYDGSDAQYNMQTYDQQQYDTSQVNLENYDYANYGQSAEPQTEEAYAGQKEISDAEPVATVEEPVLAEAQAEATAAASTEVGASSVETEVKTAKLPHSILSTSNTADKQAAPNDAQKKKKRVNFVDSSETDDSSSVKAPAVANTSGVAGVTGGVGGGAGQEGVASSESDFDFSTSAEQVGA